MPSGLSSLISNGDNSLSNVPKSDTAPSWFGLVDFTQNVTANVVNNGNIQGTAVENDVISIPAKSNAGGFLSTHYSDIFYNRIIIEPATVELGSISSQQTRTVRVFNAFFNSVTLLDIVNTNLPGITVSGSALPVIYGSLQEIEYAVTVGTEGPATIDGSFTFDWSGNIDNVVVPVTGTRIILYPFAMRPNMQERLEFFTGLITTSNGTEQRIRYRRSPRQFFSFRSYVPPKEMGRIDNLLYGGRSRIWALPVWSEARPVTSSVTQNDQTVQVDTQYGDFRVESLAIIWENSRKFDLFEIQSFTDTSITLDRGISDNFSTRAVVIPVRTSRLVSSPQKTGTAYNGVSNLDMQVLDNIRLTPAAPSEQFNGLDVFLKQPLDPGQGMTDRYDEFVEIIDFRTGSVGIHAPWNNTKPERSFDFVLEGLQEVWEFREFIHRRGGRQVPFYMPSFQNDFTIVSQGTLGDQILVVDDERERLADNRITVAFSIDDGTWELRTITGATIQSNNQELITLNSPLNLDVSRIQQMCYMGQKRLSGDTVEILWIQNNVALVTLSIKEVVP